MFEKDEHNKYPCKAHNEKKIKYYCYEENEFFCSKCQPMHFDHYQKFKEINPNEMGNSILAIQIDLDNIMQI